MIMKTMPQIVSSLAATWLLAHLVEVSAQNTADINGRRDGRQYSQIGDIQACCKLDIGRNYASLSAAAYGIG